ncbi:MAG: DnaD domain protein [Acholeplasmatales bacterium]|nr:DnaD domain protein [Acholeplasmatales bacterium]
MAMRIVDSKSKFNIYSSFILSHDDVVTLSLLYAPLIGSDAFLLYMGFTSLLSRNNLKSEELTHQSFFDVYSLKPQGFMKARLKLEGIGLLNTYINESGDYIYTVNPPFTAKNFIKDVSLGLYLFSKIGEDNFNYINNHFKLEKIDKEGYKNITKTFDEIYESQLDDSVTIKKFDYILGRNVRDSIKVNKKNFNIDSFLKMINKDFLERGVTEEFKTQIINISYVYGFDENQMASLYSDSINKKELFDYKLLKTKANTLFKFIRNMNAPKLEIKDENNVSDSDLIEYLDSTDATKLLDDVLGEYDPNYLSTVLSIYENIDLPRGVLNCMIIKVLKDKGGELPSLAYFKKVALSWGKDNVLTTSDAAKYITTLKESNINNRESIYDKGNYDVSGGLDEL